MAIGNGVGLCQTGADRMGRDGRSYRQILEFYYPGTALGVAAQGFPWQSLAGERITVITTKPGEDRAIVAIADRLALAAEQRSRYGGTRVRSCESIQRSPRFEMRQASQAGSPPVLAGV